jgi:hypothetical protein
MGGPRSQGRGAGAATALISLLCALVAACGGPVVAKPHRTSLAAKAHRSSLAAHHQRRPAGQPPPPTTTTTSTTVNPGRLPQTAARPTTNAAFNDRMEALWRGVVTGSVGPAMPAFFPLAAYLQVKAIADPGADWHQRLVGEYAADIQAAHHLLGPRPGKAQLLRVEVPAWQEAWIPPGDCYNRIGYWHVPGSRLLYREDGQLRSFGIASLISWRGAWYVVHLGAVLRPSPGGVVDSPAVGAGAFGSPGGC